MRVWSAGQRHGCACAVGGKQSTRLQWLHLWTVVVSTKRRTGAFPKGTLQKTLLAPSPTEWYIRRAELTMGERNFEMNTMQTILLSHRKTTDNAPLLLFDQLRGC